MMRSHTSKIALAVASFLALCFVPAVGVGAESARPAGTPNETARVSMIDDRFRPRTIRVSRGTRIRWRNDGGRVHSATATDHAWDSGLLTPGETWSRVFRARGTFAYFCTVHLDMRGTIEVT